VRLLKDEPSGGRHQLVVTATKVAVDHLGALLLAESYGQHLHQAAFDRALEVRVGLDPSHDQNAVGPQGIPVEIDGDVVDPAHFLDVHGTDNGGAHALLGDAQAAQHLDLP